MEEPAVSSPAAEVPFRPPKTCQVLKVYNGENPSSNEQVFWLVGTAHISKASCDDVRNVIRAIKPEVVLLELCNERRMILVADELKVQSPSLSEALSEWQSGRIGIFQALYGWFLGAAAAQMEVLPGEEFRVAVAEARSIRAKVVLGDRPLQVTLARLWASLSLWERLQLVGMLLFQGLKLPDKEELDAMLEGFKETDAMTAAIEDLARSMPAFKHVLISERDLFMTFMLRKLSRRFTRVVAVVGAGHLPGIRESWESEVDVEELMRMPEKRQRRGPSVVTMLGVACGGVLLTTIIIRWRR